MIEEFFYNPKDADLIKSLYSQSINAREAERRLSEPEIIEEPIITLESCIKDLERDLLAIMDNKSAKDSAKIISNKIIDVVLMFEKIDQRDFMDNFIMYLKQKG